MPLNIPEGYGLLSMVHDSPDYQSGPFVWTLGVQIIGEAGTLSERAYQLCVAASSAWATTLGLSTHSTCSLSEVRMMIRQGSDLGSVSAGGQAATGGGTDTFMPPNCSAIIDKYTARPGRKGRGRLNLPMVLPDQYVSIEGIIDPGQVSTLQTRFDDWIEDGIGNAANDTTGLPVILHSDSSTPDYITAFRVNQRIGTLRKRLR